MERRQFIENAAIVTAGLAATALRTPTANAADVSKTKVSPLLIRTPDALGPLQKFAEAASNCALKGDFCVEYCEEQLATGAIEFSSCLVASTQMTVVCGTVAKLAALKSVRLSETLDACAAACKACKEACEEHKPHWQHGMHLECKACFEHCENMMTEVSKLKAVLGKS
jgi:Cys-rich four helix bundle protein (predicted Tat secretion target)